MMTASPSTLGEMSGSTKDDCGLTDFPGTESDLKVMVTCLALGVWDPQFNSLFSVPTVC